MSTREGIDKRFRSNKSVNMGLNGKVYEHGLGVSNLPSPEHRNGELINTKFSQCLTKNELLTRRSIINSIWTLTDTQIGWLNIRSLRATTVSKLYELISTDHDYLDHIRGYKINDTIYDYRVAYINGSTGWLEKLIDDKKGDTPCLISFRGSKEYSTFTALVMLDKEGSLKDMAKKVKWL